MKKELEAWGEDFNLTSDDTELIESFCINAIEEFKQRSAMGNISYSQFIKKIKRLAKALDDLTDLEQAALILMAGPGKPGLLDDLPGNCHTVIQCIKLLKVMSNEALKNYPKMKVSKGGAPEKIPGRGALAEQVAIAMSLIIWPTKTPDTGAFDRLLHIVFNEAGINSKTDSAESDKDLKSVRDNAVDATLKIYREQAPKIMNEVCKIDTTPPN